jgi:FkbM family methyltransferase
MRGMTPADFARRAPRALQRRLWWLARGSTLGQVVRTSGAVVPRQRLAFAWRELMGHGESRSWLLKHGHRTVTLRSGSRDRDILREMFVDQTYALPPEVEGILRRRKQPKIVDLGANIGLFGLWVLNQWPDAQVHGFEPDPANLAILDRNLTSAPVASNWSVTRACAAPADGTIRFLTGRHAESRAIYEGEVTAEVTELPTVDVFPHLQDVDLLKIDIEGGEWPLLTDPRFDGLTVPAIVLEYHGYNCPGPGDSAQTARRLLEGRGYKVLETQRHPIGVGTLWAYRPHGLQHG